MWYMNVEHANISDIYSFWKFCLWVELHVTYQPQLSLVLMKFLVFSQASIHPSIHVICYNWRVSINRVSENPVISSIRHAAELAESAHSCSQDLSVSLRLDRGWGSEGNLLDMRTGRQGGGSWSWCSITESYGGVLLVCGSCQWLNIVPLHSSCSLAGTLWNRKGGITSQADWRRLLLCVPRKSVLWRVLTLVLLLVAPSCISTLQNVSQAATSIRIIAQFLWLGWGWLPETGAFWSKKHFES